MVSITFVYLIAGIGIVIGIAIGVVIVGLRQDNPSAPDVHSGASEGADIALGLSPKPGSDSYELILDNVHYQDPDSLSEEAKAKILGFMKVLWGYSKTDVPPIWDFEQNDKPAANAQTQEVHENIPIEVPASPGNKASINPMGIFARALQPDSPKVPEKPSSIAAQIDEILQEMIDGTPLETKGIRLYENPTKGLVVLVGMTQFDSVEDVTDEEVRQTIHAAVVEWERRMAPE